MKKNNSARESKEFRFYLENVRCFGKKQPFVIRPLTLLMGENSTGKTTAMSCLSAMSIASQIPSFNFNQSPYQMGGFRDICRHGEKSFSIGFEQRSQSQRWRFAPSRRDEDSAPHLVESATHITNGQNMSPSEFTFIRQMGYRPSCEIVTPEFKLKVNRDRLIINSKGQEINVPSKQEGDRGSILARLLEGDMPLPLCLFEMLFVLRGYLPEEEKSVNRSSGTKFSSHTMAPIEEAIKLIHCIRKNHLRTLDRGIFLFPLNFAPVRAKPKRTYDVVQKGFDSEGHDAPGRLLKLAKQKNWNEIKQKIENFAQAAGLFQKIEVKRYGPGVGEPFQLRFNVRGEVVSNIVDIGYGVSQILPLLAHIFDEAAPVQNKSKNKKLAGYCYLLQQPEVHLHPRARVELISLLVNNIKSYNNAFIIETHSDFMMGRLGIEIRRKNLSPQDVSLIYLEPKKEGVKVHNIEFDEMGNVLGAPEGYRKFFLDERDRRLGFKD